MKKIENKLVFSPKFKRNFVITISVLLILALIVFLVVKDIYVVPENYTQEKKYSLNLENYSLFKEKTKTYTIIPGIKQGQIPQGITYSNKYDVMITSGYHKGTAPSVLNIIDYKTGEYQKSIQLLYKGESSKAHVGGITTDNETVWIVSDNFLYKVSLNDLVNKENMSEIEMELEKELNQRADFCTYHNGILWIGEFFQNSKYKTEESHHLKLNDEEVNKAFLVGYKNMKAKYILSIPEKIQGVAFTDNEIILSQSYGGRTSSHLLFYQNPMANEKDTVFEFKDKKIPVWYLGKKQLNKDILMPPMSEEIVNVENNLYILFESASNLYQTYALDKVDTILKYCLK